MSGPAEVRVFAPATVANLGPGLDVLGLALAAGAPLRVAAELANHAAGIVVGKLGTATVTQEELRKAVSAS